MDTCTTRDFAVGRWEALPHFPAPLPSRADACATGQTCSASGCHKWQCLLSQKPCHKKRTRPYFTFVCSQNGLHLLAAEVLSLGTIPAPSFAPSVAASQHQGVMRGAPSKLAPSIKPSPYLPSRLRSSIHPSIHPFTSQRAAPQTVPTPSIHPPIHPSIRPLRQLCVLHGGTPTQQQYRQYNEHSQDAKQNVRGGVRPADHLAVRQAGVL